MSSIANNHKRESLLRVPGAILTTTEDSLKSALLEIVPDGQTQRKVFKQLFPHIQPLRNKGCSWAQIATLLNECGIQLKASTVRCYFSEVSQSLISDIDQSATK